MAIYVKLSAVALYAAAVYQVYAGIDALWGRRAVCDCEHLPSRSIFRNTIAYGLFIAPLLLGFMLPDAALGSAAAAKKGINLNATSYLMNGKIQTASNPIVKADITNAPAAPNNPPPVPANNNSSPAAVPDNTKKSSDSGDSKTTDHQLAVMFKTDKYMVDYGKLGMALYKKELIQVQDDIMMEILTSLDLFMDNFIGKKIEMSGFVDRPEGVKDNQFVVARFAVSCCSADAAPYGVLVEFDNSRNFAKDSWVKVTGTIGKTEFNGNEIIKINATKVEKIPAAKTTYIYPEDDFLDKLK
jgi:uncharacterized repeat protein (TIGR03943 family)